MLQKAPEGLAAARVRTLLTAWCCEEGHRGGASDPGLMHHDIDPANILLRDDDRVVLIDFELQPGGDDGQTTA